MPKLEAPLDMDGSKIHNVDDPAAAQDAATKAYVDSQVVGAGGVTPFVFEQDIAAAIWTVVHNLGYFPNVTVVDTLGREFEGSVAYVDSDSLTITFGVAVTGKAYLS